MTHIKIQKTLKIISFSLCGFVFTLIVAFLIYQLAYAERILPRVYAGTLSLGSLTMVEAREKLTTHEKHMRELGVTVDVEGSREQIPLEDIGFSLSVDETLNRAFSYGREDSWHFMAKKWIAALFSGTYLETSIEVNKKSLESEISTIARFYDDPRRDIRFNIQDAEVKVLYDTRTGKLLPRDKLRDLILTSLVGLNTSIIFISLEDDSPVVDANTVEESIKEAEKILISSIKLVYKGQSFLIEKEKIGSWISSLYNGNRLVPGLNEEAISVYVTEVAENINTVPQDVRVKVVDNKVIDFVPPKSGKVLEEDETVGLILASLNERREGAETTQEISLPVTIKKPFVDETASSLGIVELVGKGATNFTGSPKNRIHNIKNGVKFLSGTLIPPGEEFSTVKTLGSVSNATGYLPELIIKGNRTIPEYGGGLCQVSTTLFRAVLNAGLPITARRNHSYRVSYYEKDAEGNIIGPGLDATVYTSGPDLRFVNDTGATILIQGYVEGDVITFEFYGTKDGRTAEVDGPHLLNSIAPGPPIYTETDTLDKGVTKRIEMAHAGGNAIATYKVTYSDGKINEQVFKSYYRPWPAQYLVGTKEPEPE